MGRVLAVNNLLIGVFIVCFSVTFIVLSNSETRFVDVKITPLLQTISPGDAGNSAAKVANIASNSVNKKTSSMSNSTHTAGVVSASIGNDGVTAIIPNEVTLDELNPQTHSSPTRPIVVRAKINSNQSASSPAVNRVNIPIPRVGESIPSQAVSSDLMLNNTAPEVDSRSNANDSVSSSNPTTVLAITSDSTNEQSINHDSSHADNRPVDTPQHQWKIYEQRRLATCQQFTEFLVKSGKSLYDLERRTRLVMTDTFNCF